MGLKYEITSEQYWAFPEVLRDKYQQTSLTFDGYEWVEREFYGSTPVKIKTVYRLKPKNSGQTGSFGGMGMGTF